MSLFSDAKKGRNFENIPYNSLGVGAVTTLAERSLYFFIEADLARAVTDFYKDGNAFEKSRPLWRLPFPFTWIELNAESRGWPSAAEEKNLAKPGRLALCMIDTHRVEELEGRRTMFDAPITSCGIRADVTCFLFWDTPAVAGSSNNMSGVIETADLGQIRAVGPPDTQSPGVLCTPNPYIERAYCDEYIARGLHQEDWSHEIHYFLAALALLNSPNMISTRPASPGKKQARPLEAPNDGPTYSHKIVTLSTDVKADIAAEAVLARGAGTPQRAHMVRAHFKVRATGVFRWKAFMRGDLARGFVDKDYDVFKGKPDHKPDDDGARP